MNRKVGTMITRIALIISLSCFCSFAENEFLNDAIKDAISNRHIACVFVDCKSGKVITPDSIASSIRYAPCSTFKIWNTLIGVECKIIDSANMHFYTWDSIPRFFSAWNRDLTLKEAFQASCVPAFQTLARKIGNERMEKWIAAINYGDKNISSGIDDFWLPSEGKRSIEISPMEQAELIRKLVNNELPFSAESQSILKEVMISSKTSKGVCYGKTGSSKTNYKGIKNQSIGWFVGYITNNDRAYSFSCLIQGENVSGKDSKGIIESILKRSGLL